MPAPVRDIIASPTTAQVQVKLEPTYNAFNSLVMLSGLGDWVVKTDDAMSKKERARHELVIIGFYFAAMPDRSWPSFPDYLDHLDSMSPVALRDKLLDAYETMPCMGDVEGLKLGAAEALESVGNYLEFLGQRFTPEHVDEKLESEAYSYVIDPPAMKGLIIDHLRDMWETHLKVEWERVKPMLLDAVAAFEQVDYGNMERLEIVQFITGQELTHEYWISMIEEAEQLVFVPSAHVGPYLGKFSSGDVHGIIFGARLPEGTQYYAPDLSRTEILVLLNALADDTRLRILKLVAEEGELRSQEIMRELELSQSATSRHLKQLSATGFLTERRCEGAKCYNLNDERVDDTIHALSGFLASG
jgi:DNA-binding transcriptional ArsR family regulator